MSCNKTGEMFEENSSCGDSQNSINDKREGMHSVIKVLFHSISKLASSSTRQSALVADIRDWSDDWKLEARGKSRLNLDFRLFF